MRLTLCEGESLRLCASCARNVENATPSPGVDTRPRLNPTTRGERCFDWYSLPPTPKPAPSAG